MANWEQARPESVVCAALNFRGAWDGLAPQFSADPYKQPPRAPVLYLKPPNTYNVSSAAIVCPTGVAALRMGGTLGVVIARAACHVQPGAALSHVAGYVVTNDVSVPHESYYRPAIRERCRDTFHPMGPVVPRDAVSNPNALVIRMFVNGTLAAENSTANLVRGIEQLLCDVTEFMTLAEGDVLVVGEPENAPLARVGDRVRIDIPGVGAVENHIVAEHT